ncbi:MAG: hypothetical protein AAF996_11575 [Pseudomonadota bacterium]
MTDESRAEITNGIWLCRNCHKLVDQNAKEYSASLLFEWRRQHERYVATEMGSTAVSIAHAVSHRIVEQFADYPSVISRIAIDKPTGWHWRLSAELLRYLNKPILRRYDDLQDQLISRSVEHLTDENVLRWISERIHENIVAVEPFPALISRLQSAWDLASDDDVIDEVHHICKLIRDALSHAIDLEERVYFARVPEGLEPLQELLKRVIGSQAIKFEQLPQYLDETITLLGTEHGGTIENPRVVERSIEFSVPRGWNKAMERELERAERLIMGRIDLY